MFFKSFLSLFLGLSFLLTSSLLADIEDTNDNCPGEVLPISAGLNTFFGVDVPAGDIDYYQATFPYTGSIEVMWIKGAPKDGSFLIGSNCNTSDIYDGSVLAATHGPISHTLLNDNETLYFKVYNGGNNESYTLTITYTPDIPFALSPSTFNINAGADNGTYVGTVTTAKYTDVNISYTCNSLGCGTLFDLNATTGEITIHDNAYFTDTISEYTLTIEADDADNPGTFPTSTTVKINVIPELSTQCESFPRALNVFWYNGTIDISSGLSMTTPEGKLNVNTTSLSSNAICNGGACYPSDEDTKAINMPPFRQSGDNCNSPTVITSPKTYRSDWHYSGNTLVYDIMDGATALPTNAIELAANSNLTLTITQDYGANGGVDNYDRTEYIPYVFACVTVGEDATLTLEPGEYFIEVLNLDPSATIKVAGIGDGSGTARIYLNPAGATSAPDTTLTGHINSDGTPSQLLIATYAAEITLYETTINAYVYNATEYVNIGSEVSMTGAVTSRDIRTVSASDSTIDWVQPALDHKINGCWGGYYVTSYEETPYGPFVLHDINRSIGTIFTKKVLENFDMSLTHLSNTSPQIPADYNGTSSNTIYVRLLDNGTYTFDNNGDVILNPASECRQPLDAESNYLNYVDKLEQIGHYVKVDFPVDNNGDPDTYDFSENDINGNLISVDTANRDVYLQTIFYEFGDLIVDWEHSGQSCTTSSTTGNLDGVPQCLNTADKLINVGYGHCIDYCDSNDPVAKAGGCFECIAGKYSIKRCSDAFAVRPKKFNISVTDYNLSNPVVAGEPLRISLEALDNTETNASKAYNELVGTTFTTKFEDDINSTLCPPREFYYEANGSIFNITAGWNFVDGNKSDIYRYEDVGRLDINISEDQDTANCVTRYAAVDCNDTDTNDTVTMIEPFENPIVIVPHHFNLDGNVTQPGGTFTYLSNFWKYQTVDDRNMSAMIDLNITAKSQTETTTRNYNEECYAREGNFTYNLELGPIHDQKGLTKMFIIDLNNTINDKNESLSLDIPTALPITTIVPVDPTSFVAGEHNGTAQFAWRLNFDKNNSSPVNPFSIKFVDGNYTDNNASGEATFDKNATFYYGRIHAPRYRVDGYSDDLLFYYEVYCQNCNQILLTNVSPDRNLSVDDIRWYQNAIHSEATGKILEDAQARNTDLNDKFSNLGTNRITGNKTQATYGYSTNEHHFPFKATIEVNASSWLLYNKFDENKNTTSFELEFNNIGGEAGTGPGGVDDTGAVNTNRRIQW